MITLEDWALIRGLNLSEGVSKAQIAIDLGISRNTVAKAVASVDPPEYSRAPVVRSFEPFEHQVRQLLKATPSMPATVLAERGGWRGSATWFRQNVASIGADYAPTDPADRIVYHPGDQVQCDLWFPEPRIPLADGTEMMLPVLVMVASFSKFITALMIPSRTTADLLSGMWALLRYSGRTHTLYASQLREWFAWCESNGLDPLVGVQRAHVELYIRSLGDRGLMDSTVVTMMHGVRGYFRFAHIDGLVPADPAVYARLPKVHRDESRTQGLDRLELIRFL